MRDDKNGASFPVQLMKNVQDRILICFVKVAGRFVGQDQPGILLGASIIEHFPRCGRLKRLWLLFPMVRSVKQ
jgi:hypothetical protein